MVQIAVNWMGEKSREKTGQVTSAKPSWCVRLKMKHCMLCLECTEAIEYGGPEGTLNIYIYVNIDGNIHGFCPKSQVFTSVFAICDPTQILT